MALTTSITQPKLKRRQPEPDLGERPFEEIEPFDLPTDVLIDQASEIASQRMEGVLPDDVREFVEQTTAEKGIIQGQGLGQASRYLTARDLGISSLQLQEAGVDTALKLAEADARRAGLELQRNIANEELNVKMNQLRQEQIEWYDRFAAQLIAHDLSDREIAVQVSDILARSTAVEVQVLSDLVISNSKDEIAGVADDVAAIQEIFEDQGIAILDLTGLL